MNKTNFMLNKTLMKFFNKHYLFSASLGLMGESNLYHIRSDRHVLIEEVEGKLSVHMTN